jgi:hypothetical protein
MRPFKGKFRPDQIPFLNQNSKNNPAVFFPVDAQNGPVARFEIQSG